MLALAVVVPVLMRGEATDAESTSVRADSNSYAKESHS